MTRGTKSTISSQPDMPDAGAMEVLLDEARFAEVRALIEAGFPLDTRIGERHESLLQAAVGQGRGSTRSSYRS